MEPWQVEERNREVVRIIACCLTLFEHGAYDTHRSRNHRDGQVKMLLKTVYEKMTGESLLFSDKPAVHLAEDPRKKNDFEF